MTSSNEKQPLREGYKTQESKLRHNGYQPQYGTDGSKSGNETYGYQPTSGNAKPLTNPPTGRIPIQAPDKAGEGNK